MNFKIEDPLKEVERIKASQREWGKQISDAQDALYEENRQREEKDEQYKLSILNTLQGIEKNTGGIAELVKLVHDSNEKQEQIIELLSEIMSISAAKTKEEADSKFKKALEKISSLGTAVESAQTLFGLLNTVYSSVQPLLTSIAQT